MTIIRKIDQGLDKLASGLLIATVFSMLLLSVSGIVLRWFNVSFMWLDPLVRHLVFISAFLGGVLATGRQTHIGIEIIPKFLEAKGDFKNLAIIRVIIGIISTGTLVWISKASYDFFKIELQYGKEAFLGIHSGYLVGIIPAGFAFLAIRFFFSVFIQANKIKE